MEYWFIKVSIRIIKIENIYSNLNIIIIKVEFK